MRTLHPIPSLLLLLGLATAFLQADTLVVLPGTSIQAKIDEAADGDIIATFGGTYNEDITIDKAVRLVELQGQEVTLTGHVLFDGVADCPPFEGFNVGGPDKVLTVRDTTGLTISGVTSIGNGVTVEGDSEVSITNSNLSRVHQKGGELVLSHSTITLFDQDGWGFYSGSGALQTVLYRVKTQDSEIRVNSRRNWIGYCQIKNGGLSLGWDEGHDGERKFVVVGTEVDRGNRGDHRTNDRSGVIGDGRAGSIVIANCWIHGVRGLGDHPDHYNVIGIRHPGQSGQPVLIQNNHLEHDWVASAVTIYAHGDGDHSKVLIRNNYFVNSSSQAIGARFGAVVQGNVLRGGAGNTFNVFHGVTIREADANTKLAWDTDPGFEEGTVYRLAPDSVLRDTGTPNPLYNDRDGSRNDAGASGGVWYDPEGWTTDKPVVISFDLTPELVLEGVNTEVTVDEVKAVSAPASGTIVGGEFYLGDDPGEGNGDALSLAEGSSLAACFEEATISLAGLDPGIYDVGVRVQDDEDRWSTAIIRRFTLLPGDFELAGGLDRDGPASQGQTDTSGAGAFGAGVIGEYFVGADPGEGNGDALSLAEGSSLAACFEEATISLAGLDPGIYDVGVRVQDDEDRWSTAIIRRFTLLPGDFELAGGVDRAGPANQPAETLLADRVGQQWHLTLPAVLESREYLLQIGDLLVPLEVGEFDEREVVLGRLRQVLNSSLYVTSRMEVLTISGETLSLTFLEPGRHSASWVASEDFVVTLEQSGAIGAAAARIVEAEYFLNVAPRPGEGIAVPIEGDGSDTVESISALVLPIASLKAGTHAVGIRFRNADGHWGNPVWRRFTNFSLFGDLDLEPPVLTLNGGASLEVGLGSEFADPGASALDAEDGDLSDQVVLRALPDTTLPGEQVIEYVVADRAGNVGTIQRTVVVTAQPVTTVSLTVAGPLANGAVNGNQQTYLLGQQATLTAVADPGYLFTGWTGDAPGTGNPLTLVMDADRTVGATFAQDERDPDGDGLSNYQEWLAGTDPNDQSSTFRPLGTHDGTNYHLSVPTITGRSYKISISLNLQDWLPYGTLNGDDTSQVWTFDETTVPEGPFHSNQHPFRYFFRVEISILEP